MRMTHTKLQKLPISANAVSVARKNTRAFLALTAHKVSKTRTIIKTTFVDERLKVENCRLRPSWKKYSQ